MKENKKHLDLKIFGKNLNYNSSFDRWFECDLKRELMAKRSVIDTVNSSYRK